MSAAEYVMCPACRATVLRAPFCRYCGARVGETDSQPQVRPDSADQPASRSEPKERRVRRYAILAAAAAFLLTAAIVLFTSRGEQHTVLGTLSLPITNTDGSLDEPGPCQGTGGYDDIHGGRQLVLEDANGTTVATSNLSEGRTEGVRCVFHFDFKEVPKATFYRVHQNGNRGAIQYSYADLVKADWSVDLTLGD